MAGDVGELFFGKFGVHGQADHLGGELLRNRKVSFLVAIIPVGRLQVAGDRIIYHGGDVLRIHVGFDRISLFPSFQDPKCILVEYMVCVGSPSGEAQFGMAPQQFVIF